MPRGQRVFSRAVADQIRVLLSQTHTAPRSQQKALRQRVRSRVYISDHYRPATGFTPGDFDDLVRRGEISIVG